MSLNYLENLPNYVKSHSDSTACCLNWYVDVVFVRLDKAFKFCQVHIQCHSWGLPMVTDGCQSVLEKQKKVLYVFKLEHDGPDCLYQPDTVAVTVLLLENGAGFEF